ncbi:MAG: RNA pseudouridine synthase [Gammaproteobacteria bacterium]|nr:RNA pseudouridine synthase [Gammaproteobacteria bacterium]
MIIVNKPSKLLSVPGRGENKQDCMISRIQHEYPEVLTVHRLDMDTSGIMLFARNAQSQRDLSQLFQLRKIKKQYIALVDGIINEACGEINLPLIVDWPNRPKQMVDPVNGKPSCTLFRIINTDQEKNTTRVELTPITGRSHQLRVHMLAIGHAILGDKLYSENNEVHKTSRLLLHADHMDFIQPVTNRSITIECPEPF